MTTAPKLFLEPEYNDNYTAWRQQPNSPEATGKLLQQLEPVMDSALRTYTSQPSPTLKSKAKLITLNALQKYDPTRAKLKTHLMFHLQGLRRASVKEQQLISVPERIALDLHHLHTKTEELSDSLGREPNDQELADHTGLSPKRLAYIRSVKPSFTEGYLGSLQPHDDNKQDYQPAIQAGDDKAWLDLVYDDLSPVDKVIMENFTGHTGKKIISKQQLAKKLHLSISAVSQRAAKIQDKISRRADYGLL